MIVISGEILEKVLKKKKSADVFFNCWDKGDVYNLIQDKNFQVAVHGTLLYTTDKEFISIADEGKNNDLVRIIVRKYLAGFKTSMENSSELMKVIGYVKNGKNWEEVPVQIVPVKKDIFSRFRGILETNALSNKKVFIIGLGSGGSQLASELSNSGVMYLCLMDYDRYEVSNVMRQLPGLSHVGRYKTNAIADLIKDKNPFAKIQTWTAKVSWKIIDEIRKVVQKVDLAICATDSKESKLIMNRVCFEEKKPCIFPGAFRRAYGGQILFVRPGKSLCYQCFCMYVPKFAKDEEISNLEQAEGLAYTDRPVPIEPGLSNDIAPISTMTVKLAIQELIKDTNTTLESLNDDLVASWYLWINRREAGTQFEDLKPLEFNIDGMHILRWYGIDVKPHPACPVCGDFQGHLAKQAGIDLPFSDV